MTEKRSTLVQPPRPAGGSPSAGGLRAAPPSPARVLTISAAELHTAKVEAKLKEHQLVRSTHAHYEQLQLPTGAARAPRFQWLYNTAVYMGLFGLLGGLLGWGFGAVMHFRPDARTQARSLIEAQDELQRAVAEERLNDAQAEIAMRELRHEGRRNPYFQIHIDASLTPAERRARWDAIAAGDDWRDFLANLLFYGVSGMTIAVCLAAAESVVERNWQGAVVYASVGAAAGLAGGVVLALLVPRLHAYVLGHFAAGMPAANRQLLANLVAWGALGLFLAAAPGLVLRNAKKIGVGMVGGLLGGIVGGLLFEPVERYAGSAQVSRLVAILAIGVVAGVATGLIENALKTGWFKVTGGLIAGKQFVLYRNPTYIGSSPQSHIYLFKDPAVGRRHAAVHLVGNGFELEDLPLGSKTLVNGKPIARARLRNGDRVQVGGTVFSFQEKVKA